MAQTTTAVSACGARIWLDNDADSLVEISGSANRANLTFNRQIGSGNTFDGSFPVRVECKRDGSLELNIMYTTANNEGRDLLEAWYQAGGRRTIAVYPNGMDTGERYYSGEFLLQEFSVPLDASSADPLMITATLVPDGAISFLNAA